MANRYWNPAGAANWGDANVWATTAGGDPTGIATPTSADDVFFTSTNVNNCAVAATADCLSISFTGGTGYTGTFSGASALNVYGDLTLNSGVNRTYTGLITFKATSTGKTITSNTKALASNVTFDGVGGEWTLADALNIGVNGTLTVTNGSFVTGNQNITCGGISSSNSNVRSINLGSSTITSSMGWSLATTTNLTWDAGTSVINGTLSGGSFQGGGLTFYDFTFNVDSTLEIQGTNSFHNFSFTGGASKVRTFSLGANQTISGTFTVNGNSAINRILLKSDVLGTARTITAATVSGGSGVDFQDIIGAGAGSWDLSGAANYSGDCGGNTGITFTTADDCFWIGGTGNWSATAEWSTSSGGAGGQRVPLPQDAAIFDANSFTGSQTVTQDMPRIGSVTFADTDAAFTFTPSTDCSVFGDVILDTNLTFGAGTQIYTFEKRGVQTLDCAGKTWEKNFQIKNIVGVGTLKLVANCTLGVTRTLFVTSGTFTCVDGANNYILSTGKVSVGTDGTITLGSATHLLTGTGTVWTGTGTISASTGTLKVTDTSNTAITFAAGTSKSYNNLWFDRGASTATNTITATTGLTLAEFKDTGTAAHTNVMPNVTTNVTSFVADGSAGNVISFTRTGASGTWTVSDTTGTNTVTYCNISNSTATGGATWKAWTADGNVDGGGNTGWQFAEPSAGGAGLLLMGVG